MPFIEMIDDNLPALKELSKQGKVNFDWSIKSSPKAKTVILVNNGEINGLVEFQKEMGTHKMWLIEVVRDYRGSTIAGKLLAYVGRDSLKEGNDGFFFFEPKDSLRNYYMDKYGAKISAGRNLYFDTAATQKLISTYLTQND